MTNIVGQLFKSLDPWPGFQITSFKIQVSPVDGRKTLILDLRPVEGSMPICSRCRHEAPLVHSYVSRRIKECSLLGYFVELNVTFRRVDCLHCKGHPMEAVEWLAPFKRYTERLREHVEHRTLEETVAYAAQETNLSWDTVKEIDKARLRRLYEHFHWDNSRRLAVDEFAIHRGHRYATVVYSIDTKKVLWLDRGRSRATLRKFFNLLTPEQKAGSVRISVSGEVIPGAAQRGCLLFFVMQYARPDAIAGAKVEGPARSAGGSSLAPAIARREAAGALAREV